MPAANRTHCQSPIEAGLLGRVPGSPFRRFCGLIALAAGLLGSGHQGSDAVADVEADVTEAVVTKQTPAQPEAPARPVSASESLYVKHCAACHGVQGHGDGPAAEQLYPKPRAFHESPFRFASTGGTKDQVIGAVEQTITRGVPRSAMPGFGGVLPADQIAGLARYVVDLLPAAPPLPAAGRPPASTPMPEFTPALITQGSALFSSQACVNCHGPTGHGDGPAMQGLVDSVGRPVRPADLASGLYKSGSAPEDLYRTILNGVPGTPMIGFGGLLVRENKDHSTDDRDVWALVAFVRSLAPVQLSGAASGADIRAVAAADSSMLADPSHMAWLDANRTSIAMRPLWQRAEAGVNLSVSAVRTSDAIAISIAWDDTTCDVDLDTGRFPDAVALMFALGDDVPALPMAVSMAGHSPTAPINIWQWKGNRQFDASFGWVHDSGERRVLAPGTWHAFGPPAKRAEPPSDGGEALRAAETERDLEVNRVANLTSEAAGNVHTDPTLSDRPVLEANALGFGTLTYQAADQQDVRSTAVWSNGRWFVTMVRPLGTGHVGDVDLTSKRRIPIAFAVWDGSRGDRDGIKHISGWHWLTANP